ncbi:E3 SUMO-protein ligase ZBED1-like [Pseudorasbora parva]|uniref:E3 SUMO-protein ligase ZBED1-like n=1 Tax=Pseudorasbora parva TaxID=51549 RepID=UPI00351F2153
MAASATNISPEELVSKKRTTGSIIWIYFGFKASDEQQTDVYCRECRKLVPTKASSTTNLFHHLQTRHKLAYEECTRLRIPATKPTCSDNTTNTNVTQITLHKALPWSVEYERKSARWCSITESVAFHIAVDMAPISVIEQRGFIRMLKTLDPRYSLPSRHYFARQELPRLYTTERKRLAGEMEKVTYYALTTDMWRSRTCKPYMCVTIHFILDWEIKSACLQTTYFPQDHTGENIAEALRDVTKTWMLNPNGPVAITTDNGANIVCAVQNNNWQRMQCFRSLHLGIGHGMQDPRITRAISLCKKTVSAFSYSWKKRRELAEVQAQMNLPAHQLSRESTTRWGSRLQIVERVVEQERALAKVLSADKKARPLVLTWQDIEVLEAIQKALKPLQDFTDALSGEEYVTLSYVRPVLHLFNSSLLVPEEGDSELTKSIKLTILTYLNEKYSEPSTSDLLDIASFIDPRFRGKYVSSEKLAALKERVICEAQNLLGDRGSSAGADKAVPQSAQESAIADPVSPIVKKKKTLASFFVHDATPYSSSFTPRSGSHHYISNFRKQTHC